MYHRTHFSTAILSLLLQRTRSPLRRAWLSVSLAVSLACFAPSQKAQAQLPSPAPDGGYPNQNTAEGEGALFSLTTGFQNTAIGFHALYSNTLGSENTATGYGALSSSTTGKNNTANGAFALEEDTTGGQNTANGAGALGLTTIGSNNTATGVDALFFNRSGNNNTAAGAFALEDNYGNNNTATGYEALVFNNTGSGNTANGANTLLHNTGGSSNTASGLNALRLNTSGNSNTGFGQGTLGKNTTGSFNTAIGFNAGANLTTGHDNIDIQAVGVAGESNTMRIGTVKQTATYITGIRGVNTANANAVPVVVDSAGQLGTVTSSARFKEAIKPMDKTSETILALQPVTFRYKHELDPDGIPQFGLVAEQVEKVNPDLVVRDDEGKVMSVRYEAVNAMLLNEFLKEHRRVEEQGATIAQQKKDFASELARQQKTFQEKLAQQQKQIEALTATVQKVSDQLALSKPALQLVANP
jgi:hypothetical protein